MDLYELTRAFVRRGCPEHPRLSWDNQLNPLMVSAPRRGFTPHHVHPDDARAIWTLWALEWWLAQADTDHNRQINAWNNGGEHSGTVYQCETRDCTSAWTEDWVWEIVGQGPTILEAIEAATRHLEPK